MDNTQNIISFCTGYGGFELGLRLAGLDVRTVAYVEIEAFACANLVSKIEEGRLDAAPIWTDIKTFDGQPFRNRVHGIIAGYPCQPFSNAGKRMGRKDPRHLWSYIKKHIRTIRPLWCFFENVSGHISEGFKEVVFSLHRMGYSVEAGLFTAAEVGLSMAEGTRLFILAQAESVNGGLLLQPRKSQQPDIDTGRPSEMVGQANSQRFQRLRSTGSGGWDEFTPASFAVAPQGVHQEPWEEKRYLKSGMGRTVDGFRSRVDELRLLGNGVVPQQAAKAIRKLLKQGMLF